MILLWTTIIVSLIAVILIPKRISFLEMYATSFFATFLGSLADMYLDAKYDMYGFFQKGIDLAYIPIFFIIYPAANILFLNFFPFQRPLFHKILYILACSGVTLLFEYGSLHTNVFYYNSWKLWYSGICYPPLYTLLYLNLLLLRKLKKEC